jgi:hypothetical protein
VQDSSEAKTSNLKLPPWRLHERTLGHLQLVLSTIVLWLRIVRHARIGRPPFLGRAAGQHRGRRGARGDTTLGFPRNADRRKVAGVKYPHGQGQRMAGGTSRSQLRHLQVRRKRRMDGRWRAI